MKQNVLYLLQITFSSMPHSKAQLSSVILCYLFLIDFTVTNKKT